MKKLTSILIVLAISISMWSMMPLAKTVKAETTPPDPYTYSDSTYDLYVQSHPQVYPDITPIVIQAVNYNVALTDAAVSTIADENASIGSALLTPERGGVTWTVNVAEAGFYNILVRYYPIEGKSSSIERNVIINGEVPFTSAQGVVFHRVWGDRETEVKMDLNGNHIKPIQIETPMWREIYIKDDLGYTVEPFVFYLNAGENTIGLVAIKEPMLIDTLTLTSKVEYQSYETYKQANASKPAATNQSIRIEGESAIAKSSPTLYAITDRSSSLTRPYHPALIRLNTIGGDKWKIPGDWITWEFEVEEAGYYNISIRAKQNQVRGIFSGRMFYLNGEVLFQEMTNAAFKYNQKWQMVTLGNDVENYEFYLTPGRHTLTMEVTLGEYSSLIREIEDTINSLNTLYRQIIQFTGTTPDAYRDYQLTTRLPYMLATFQLEINNLKRISSEIERISGEKSDKTGLIDRIVVQLEGFVSRPRTIHTRLKTLNDNVSALGTLLQQLRELPLTIDYIMVHTPDVALPKANEGFFAALWHSIRAFFYSFIIDYSAIGATSEASGNRRIEVWMTMGRDQANVIRTLIDETFTPESGIIVDLKLVAPDVLLRATLAGKGPDVALNVDATLPVNYALRNAVYDLRLFPDYEQVATRFHHSANDQFSFNGGTFALPERQTFLMMFVRDDIVKDLGLKIPDTWDDIIEIIPDLQSNHLQFFLPVNEEGATALNPIFVSLLYQYGGELYINDNKESGLSSEAAMLAFEHWTEFYTLYSFPRSANFVNRFRSGEMPMGIAYYDAYNTLSVFAPELRGKWSFYPIPGLRKVDPVTQEEYIDRTGVAVGTGVVLMKQNAIRSEQKKNDSWEFMKWYTSTNTQVRFGREMEGILGAAARHTSANMAALEQLAWPVKDYEKLSAQWETIQTLPQVAGSYISGREVENAFRQTINNNVNARETLYDYVLLINREIDRKRKEFGLPLA